MASICHCGDPYQTESVPHMTWSAPIPLISVPTKAADTRMPAYSEDRLASLKSEYELAAKTPSNLRYGYVRAA